jgi:ribonuclease P protein component
VVLVANGEMGQRLGITVSRKVGNAVVRNRIKRGIREWFRRCRDEMAGDIDLVVIARPAARDLTAIQMGDALKRLIAEAGVAR